MPTPELRSDRLRLRGWTDTDRDVFAQLNADPVVMTHFPSTLTREESDAFVDRIDAGFAEHGFGLWAVEVIATGEFIGFTGLSVPRFHAAWMEDRPQQPVVEVGWRLRRSAWGHGYASEAARASLSFGFEEVGLREIVSFTVVGNVRSQAVMHRVGMTRLAEYDHPVPGREALPSVVYHRPVRGSWV
ncbi:MAG TPA: GNAT family N-acetyltransferase [Nocardioidaceae bacterium]|nr:GNAT family N-acetyltransferase [Nocardioidaceae bacterium]